MTFACRPCRRWLLVGLLLPFGPAWSAVLEQLEYRVSYRGLLSLGQTLTIADLVLETHAPGGQTALREIRLEASSSAYPTVEALYPLRYRFRSWALADGRGVLGLETFERTRRQRHRLYLRDDSRRGMVGHDPAEAAAQTRVARLSAGELPAAAGAGGAPLDRLGLLSQIRRQDLAAGVEYRFAVTNGEQRFAYRAAVEAAELLRLGAEEVATWKLRVEGRQVTAAGPAEVAHRPLYLWLDQASGHIPVRLESRHALGLFRIELVPGRQRRQVARRMP